MHSTTISPAKPLHSDVNVYYAKTCADMSSTLFGLEDCTSAIFNMRSVANTVKFPQPFSSCIILIYVILIQQFPLEEKLRRIKRNLHQIFDRRAFETPVDCCGGHLFKYYKKATDTGGDIFVFIR